MAAGHHQVHVANCSEIVQDLLDLALCRLQVTDLTSGHRDLHANEIETIIDPPFPCSPHVLRTHTYYLVMVAHRHKHGQMRSHSVKP